MTTLDSFIKKYTGKFVDWDKKFGFQCMDLMRQYIYEVLGYEPYKVIPAINYAKNAFYNYNGQVFNKVLNSPKNSPKKGDIIFWKTYPFVTGVAGHVGIVQSADVNSIIVFNQNYPINSSCVTRKFNYRGVIGWLSIKQ